jgi:hypothetical protein
MIKFPLAVIITYLSKLEKFFITKISINIVIIFKVIIVAKKIEQTVEIVEEIMGDFASITGLEPAISHPQRYLWTDAFAVCNYLELFHQTDNKKYQDLALSLVNQVHSILGRHREDDKRMGWISGLNNTEGNMHPTRGGLRIGKHLNERQPNESINSTLEWDRDGQYYHYLIKWMHALNRVSRVTMDSKYTIWAIELAKTAHAAFTYLPSSGGQKRMYWKMNIDLSRPLVPSMGQHDPLEGFITYNELQITEGELYGSSSPDLNAEIGDMIRICRGMSWLTNDPLGIGGLLSDALIMAQVMIMGGLDYSVLLESVLNSALLGLESFTGNDPLKFPAEYRLAFRELGLSIGLKGIKKLLSIIVNNPDLFGLGSSLQATIDALIDYVPISEKIEHFWLNSKNRHLSNWIEHREINMVMLATSLVPEGFLMI